MSYHDVEFTRIHAGHAKTASPKVQVEVILHSKEHHHLVIQVDETKPKRRISRDGIKILSQVKSLAVLELTERRAVALNLV